jgi:hypothetical protein
VAHVRSKYTYALLVPWQVTITVPAVHVIAYRCLTTGLQTMYVPAPLPSYAAWTLRANAQLVSGPTPNPPPQDVESLGMAPEVALAPDSPLAEPADTGMEWVITIAAAAGERSGARPITSIVAVALSTDARAENRPPALTVAGEPATSTFASLGATVPATVRLLPVIVAAGDGEVIATATRGATIVLVRVTVPDTPQPDSATAAPSAAIA